MPLCKYNAGAGQEDGESGRYKEVCNYLQRIYFCESFNTIETSHLLELINHSSGDRKSVV